MISLTTKKLIAALVGLIYAVVYGFWTMSITGGGHGNFIWLGLFVFIEFFGLYFPLMIVLAFDLRSQLRKIIFGSLIAFNLVASTVMILGWATETETAGERPSDFAKMIQINGIGFVIFCALAHFLPTIIFAFLLTRSILFNKSLSDDDDLVRLRLS